MRDESGRVVMEWGMRNGVRHGVEREWAPDGALLFETRFVDGREHGTARQWQDERLLGTYRMVHGTGLDLWRDADGALSEERCYQDGQRHGYERWWNGDGRTVWQEEHYRHDIPHGIFREWNNSGRLRRGFPRYFVNGERVTKPMYMRRAAADPSLPPFRSSDNAPERSLPQEYLDQQHNPRSHP